MCRVYEVYMLTTPELEAYARRLQRVCSSRVTLKYVTLTQTLTLTLTLLVPAPRPRIAPNRRIRAHGLMSSDDNRYLILTYTPCFPKY